ncbi:MAG: Tail Collar domain protein [Candidatus Eremiobacteraeota bacterium]|nr:Tail Collar domain protein [Candidatus Eremiobacteraeota bacterium]
MSTPFMSEIRAVSFNFAPKGWALCNGQTLPINQNQALFALLGTTYGGNGQTTFALPNLQGRVAISFGAGHILGERGGEENHTLNSGEMPAHIHLAQADPTANSTKFNPLNGFPANAAPNQIYSAGSNTMAAMLPAMVTTAGGSQPHANMMPYSVLNYIIALQGIFPSQN